jgi:hypothetical protein
VVRKHQVRRELPQLAAAVTVQLVELVQMEQQTQAVAAAAQTLRAVLVAAVL